MLKVGRVGKREAATLSLCEPGGASVELSWRLVLGPLLASTARLKRAGHRLCPPASASRARQYCKDTVPTHRKH